MIHSFDIFMLWLTRRSEDRKKDRILRQNNNETQFKISNVRHRRGFFKKEIALKY